MKKFLLLMLALVLGLTYLSGCSKTELDKNKPVTLTMWHVYGEQADSPMNRLVEEFNQTVGQEKGIIINVTGMSSAYAIGNKLVEANSEKADSPDMPDLFFGHKSNALQLGLDKLVDWNELVGKEYLDGFIPEFLSDGIENDKLYVFPVTKSTHLLFICGTQFDRFSKDTGISYESLSDWDGFFNAAQKYYEWSGGKTFCCLDYPVRLAELAAISGGDENVFNENGTYTFKNNIFKSFMNRIDEAIVKGYIGISDLYANTQVMTGEVMSGIGSSAAILYYNDTVTYPDNTQEPMNLKILPIPQQNNEEKLITQAGVGLLSYKTTSQKAEAAAIFARWLTEPQRNLDFAAITGYMPVTYEAFDKIKDYDFKNENYKNLYTVYTASIESSKAVSEQPSPEYHAVLQTFYDYLRENQKSLTERYYSGEDAEILKNEIWENLKAAK